jgi:leucine dehydrogenase
MFEHEAYRDHEQVTFVAEPASGLRAIVAIHSTTLGPAFGGVRLQRYASTEAALGDALRLSRAMTLKCAIANVPYGGGKAVVLGPVTDREPAMLALGRAIEQLGGRYIAAEDLGTTLDDIRLMRRVTRHTVTLPDGIAPAPATAYGVFLAIRAAVRHRFGGGLAGRRVAIQGLGKVGGDLAHMLADAGAELVVADLDPARVAEVARATGARAVPPDSILEQPVDVLSPCAGGGVIDLHLAGRLRAVIVAGAANNQLAGPEVGRALHARGITYVPDVVANAGGVIDFAVGREGYDPARIMRAVERLEGIVLRVLADGRAPEEAALAMAERRLRGLGRAA